MNMFLDRFMSLFLWVFATFLESSMRYWRGVFEDICLRELKLELCDERVQIFTKLEISV